jgi:hypothetical protein
MRVSPAIRIKGVSRVKCQGSANPDDRSLREIAKAGRQLACTFGTLILSGASKRIDFKNLERAFLQ